MTWPASGGALAVRAMLGVRVESPLLDLALRPAPGRGPASVAAGPRRRGWRQGVAGRLFPAASLSATHLAPRPPGCQRRVQLD
eukprot:5213595-Pyramimonas_sp.AAC.1